MIPDNCQAKATNMRSGVTLSRLVGDDQRLTNNNRWMPGRQPGPQALACLPCRLGSEPASKSHCRAAAWPMGCL